MNSTMPRALLFRARTVILQLELTSNGTTTAWNTSGHGHPASKPPTNGDPTPPHLHWHHRLTTAEDEQAFTRTVEQAEAELRQIRKGTPSVTIVPETQAQLNARIVKHGEGFTVKEVAFEMRCGERVVIKARQDAGREPLHGKPVTPEPAPDRDARRDKARSLKANGYTLRQIAQLLQVGKDTISRDLRKAA